MIWQLLVCSGSIATNSQIGACFKIVFIDNQLFIKKIRNIKNKINL